MSKVLNIVFVGCTALYGRSFNAVNTKTKLMALGLLHSGARCAIYDGLLGTYDVPNNGIEYDDEGISISLPHRKGSVPIGELRNIPHLYAYLKKRKYAGAQNVVILEAPLIHNYVAYVFCAKLLGYKVSVIAHEWMPTLQLKGLYSRISGYIYTRMFGYFADSLLPISEYIIKKIKHFRKPFLKVPAISMFYQLNDIPICGDYFLYCANAGYKRIIDFVIDSYECYKKNGGNYKLILVLSGSEDAIRIIKHIVSLKGLDTSVEFYSKLKYDDLMKKFKESACLLIPLDPNSKQDIARFPQKIAEYTSTMKPIMTSDVGEISYYFKNNECIKSEFSPLSYAEKMEWIEKNKLEAQNIGVNGYNLGLREFEYKACGRKLFDFLQNN